MATPSAAMARLLGGDSQIRNLFETAATHNQATSEREPTRHRTLWISDIHLGTRGAKAEQLRNYLRRNPCDTLYLIGDIIDGWSLERNLYWNMASTHLVMHILQMARNGTRVVYVPGNHDELLREFGEFEWQGIEVRQDPVHTAADGRRYLVTHGDEFDQVTTLAPGVAEFADRSYQVLLRFNDVYNRGRKAAGMSYWSLSAWAKQRVKKVVQYMGDYSVAVVEAARKRDVDGVICGHIHHAEISQFDDIVYINDGDWVESCTALVEQKDGTMQLVHFNGDEEVEMDTSPARPVKVLKAAA